jgi:hypothetical protein
MFSCGDFPSNLNLLQLFKIYEVLRAWSISLCLQLDLLFCQFCAYCNKLLYSSKYKAQFPSSKKKKSPIIFKQFNSVRYFTWKWRYLLKLVYFILKYINAATERAPNHLYHKATSLQHVETVQQTLHKLHKIFLKFDFSKLGLGVVIKKVWQTPVWRTPKYCTF